MRKSERQQLIGALIRQHRLATQKDLVAVLVAQGCRVTQATVSRDMREMGVQKGSDATGVIRYVLPPREQRDPEGVLARVLQDAGAIVRRAQNLVVIRSEPGTAPSVGRAVDEMNNDYIIGTVAGDDTVLLVASDTGRAREVVDYLESII